MGIFSDALKAGTPSVTPSNQATPAPASGGIFSQALKGSTVPSPTAKTLTKPVTPTKTPNVLGAGDGSIPESALAGSLGGGYGTSNVTDMPGAKSANKAPLGKPLMTFENPIAKSSQLLSNRVAPTFDPAKPQKISPAMLENGRMPTSASDAVRKATGAQPDEQLDHLISLELGGSNQPENLNNEKTTNGKQYSLDSENGIAKAVANGDQTGVSYIDGQKAIARLKGVKLADDPDFDKSSHPLATNYAKPAPNQEGTQAQQQNIFQKAGSAIANGAKALFKPTAVDNTVKNIASGVMEKLINNSPPLKMLTTALAGQGLTATLKAGSFDPNKMNELNSDDINKVISKMNTLIQGGMDKQKAAKEAMGEVKGEKLSAVVIGSMDFGGDLQPIKEGIGDAAKAVESGIAESIPKGEAAGVGEDAAKVEQTVGQTPEEAAKPAPTPEQGLKKPLPIVNTDEQAINEAATKTVAGGGKGVESLDKDTQATYRDWVNQSGASNKNIAGRIAAKPFVELAGEKGAGMDAVHAFQEGDRTGKLGDVEKWSKDLLAKEQAAGIPVDARPNYLPQYWANSQSEIDKATAKYLGEDTGKNLSLKPGFSKEATFPDYATGEKYGLTPKYSNIPDMIAARTQASEKALADRAFFDKLTSQGLLQPKGGPGWKTVDPDHFPNYGFQTSDGKIYSGTLKAPADLADLINNQLRGPQSASDRLFAATAKWSTRLKAVVLSSGIPGTAVNLHGFNELAATVPELMNQPSLFTSALKYMINPNAGGKFIEDNLEMAQSATRSGLVLGGEEYTLGPVAEASVEKGPLGKIVGAFDKGKDALYNLFAKHDFEQMIPALKLQMWDDGKQFLMDQGMNEADAAHQAAVRANQTFGGLNLAEMGRDKNLQNVIRSFVFAPDFWESRFRYAGNLGKGLTGNGPMAKLYRNAALTIVGSYVAMNAVNKAKTGHFMFENPSGHSMDILAGQDSQGKDVWIRPFGTDLDFIRLPLDIAQSLTQGDASGINTDVRNRVSTLLQPLLSWTTNSDAYGNKIFGPSTISNPASKQWLSYGASLPVFPQVGTGAALLKQPNTSKFQAISQMIGLPIRFNVATTPSTSNLANEIFTERPTLQAQIKQDYLSGNEQDGLSKMSAYNQRVLQLTIQAYKDSGHQINDEKAFTNWLVNTTRANGGLKDVFLKPPSDKVIESAQAKKGQPLFNKVFPSNIQSSTTP